MTQSSYGSGSRRRKLPIIGVGFPLGIITLFFALLLVLLSSPALAESTAGTTNRNGPMAYIARGGGGGGGGGGRPQHYDHTANEHVFDLQADVTPIPQQTNNSGKQRPHIHDSTDMTWQCYVFMGIVCFVFVSLLMSLAPMFAILGLAGLILYLFGIITADQLFSGLVNNGVLAIAMLFVIVHPIVSLPAMKIMVKWILGEVPKDGDAEAKRQLTSERSARIARFKLCLLCLLTSPFLENTPQVAMFTPLVTSYCREIGVAPSQIIMPMNVAVLLGNWALLGASSNLIISGLMNNAGMNRLEFFALAKVNLILVVPVLLYCVFMPPILLPQRRGGLTFYAQIKLSHGSPYVGMRVSTLLASFLEVRKDDVDKVVVIKASGRRLAEPFSRLVTLEPGDELVLSGLLDTLKRSDEVELDAHQKASGGGEGGSTNVSMALITNDYLMNETSTTGSDGGGGGDQSHSQDEPKSPLRTIEARSDALYTQKGYCEAAVKNLVDTLFLGEAPRSFRGPFSPGIELHDTELGSSSFGPGSECHLSQGAASDFILKYNAEHNVVLTTLRVSHEGHDLLQDKVAFAMAATASTILRTPSEVADEDASRKTSEGAVAIVVPSPGEDAPHEGGGGGAHGESQVSNASVVFEGKRWEQLSLAEKHRVMGGKFYTVNVPRWFPIGTLEVPEKKTDGDLPLSPRSQTEEAKASRKTLHFPWFWQYVSLLVFMGIIIASILDVKLKISCFIGCVTVVVLQLVSCKEVARTLPVEIFLLVGFSFPLGLGMVESGLAGVLEGLLDDIDAEGFPLLMLIGGISLILTNMITNQGAAQVLLPLVLNVYAKRNKDPMPGIIMLATILCCAVCTPFAIPANAIIIEPGGYRAKDFIKFGLLLSAMMWVLSALVVAGLYDSW